MTKMLKRAVNLSHSGFVGQQSFVGDAILGACLTGETCEGHYPCLEWRNRGLSPLPDYC